VLTRSQLGCSAIGNLRPVNVSNQRWMSYVAAALLASLTVRVFFELQDYGPESSIRRFLEAIRANDGPALVADIVNPPIQNRAERAMVASLAFWQTHGVTAQVGRLERTGDEVRATVLFSLPNGTANGTIWAAVFVVKRIGRMWFVDANKTATIFWDDPPPSYIPPH
jgi:hypothetical protein